MKVSLNRTALIGLTVLGSIGIIGQQALSGPAADRSAQAKGNDVRLDTLLTQRRGLLQTIEKQCEERYRAGSATTEEVTHAAIAVIQADLELRHTHQERVALRQKWVDKLEELEKTAATQHNAGVITPVQYNEAKLARLEAEIALEREKNAH